MSNKNSKEKPALQEEEIEQKEIKEEEKKNESRMIGNYILGITIGAGGFSKVKLGKHKINGELVALKIMFADDKGEISEKKKRQLNREIKTMSKINHPNVIKLIAYYEDELYPERDGVYKKCILTVLEYASSGELFDYLSFTGRFEEKVTRSYFHQLIDGVEAIHKLGITHRDLKPENLLLDHNFILKIADFGFATPFYDQDKDEKISLKTKCGTPLYMAPEILNNEKYNEKVDIFAIGVILFVLHAGFPPFEKAKQHDWWFDRIAEGKYGTFWKAHEQHVKFSKYLKSLIIQCLQPNPENRLDVTQIKKHDWYKEKIIKKQDKLKKYLEQRREQCAVQRLQKVQVLQKNLNNKDPSLIDNSNLTIKNEHGIMDAYLERAKEIDPIFDFETKIEIIDFKDYLNVTPYQFITQRPAAEIAVRLERIVGFLQGQINFVPINTCIYITFAIKNELLKILSNKELNPNKIDENDQMVKHNHDNKDNSNNNKNEDDIENDDNLITCQVKQYKLKPSEDKITRYMVVFHRIKGSIILYNDWISKFLNAPEIARLVDTNFESLNYEDQVTVNLDEDDDDDNNDGENK